MHWRRLLLGAAAVVVAAATNANANANANAAPRVRQREELAPLLQRHVHRILSSQADDQAACDAAFASNPLSSYFSALPAAAGIRNCVASNADALLAPLGAQGATCTLNSLVSLLSSGTGGGLATFSEFFNLLASGLTTTTTTTTATASAPPLTATLANWTADSTKNEAFCSVMNKEIGPCVDALVPVLITILDKKGACCAQLVELYELLKLIVPDGKTLDQTLVAIVNGLHLAMCSTTDGATTYCGQSLLSLLSGIVDATGATSLLSPLLLDAGIPLFALPEGTAACSALDEPSFASRVSASGGAYAYAPLSCCAPKFASLIQSVDGVLKHLTGSSLADTLNLVAGTQDAASKFTSPYETLAGCTFKTTCANPSYTLAESTATPLVSTSTSKNSQVLSLKCTTAQLCDADKVCSDVCTEGTAKVAPWVARAVSYQRNLSYAQPLCFTQLLGTHNSATTLARGWGNRDQLVNKVLDATNANSYMRTNNQYLTLTDQLNLGTRLLENDVHYFGGKIRDGHCSRVSFAVLDDMSAAIKRTTEGLLSAGETTSVSVEWQSSLIGCLPSLGGIRAEESRAHADSVKEIAAWLQANPSEFVLLYLDIGAEVTTFSKYDEMLALHTAAYGDWLLTPADLSSASASWQTTPLSDLIQLGKRVAILTDKDTNGDVYFSREGVCDGWRNIPGGTPGGVAGTIWGAKTNSGTIVRAYTSQLRYATMSEDALSGGEVNGTVADPATVTAATLSVFVNAGVNIVAPDGLDGAVVEATVWSWAPNEPSRGDTAAEISAKDGRWYGVPDRSSIQNVACVSSSNRLDWQIVAQGSGCPSGFAVGAPKLAVENTALALAIKATGADASAQLDVDVSSLPVISAEDEAAFGGTSSGGGASGGTTSGTSGGSGGSSPTGASAQHGTAMAMVVVVVASVAAWL